VKFAAVLLSLAEILGVLHILLDSVRGGIPPNNFSWTNAVKAFIQRGKFCFFLCYHSELYNWEEIEALQISAVNTCIGLGYAMTSFVFLLSYNFMLAFNLTAVLTLWLAVKEFYNQSVSCLGSSLHPPESVNTVHKKYDQEKLFTSLLERYIELKTLAWKINEALGGLFLCTTFETCYFFALNLADIFAEKRWAAKIIVYHFVMKTSLFFTLSSDICHKVKLNFNLYNSMFLENLSGL